jgi:deazaflavin-dependent oxidoreductase (nitroreductase family)
MIPFMKMPLIPYRLGLGWMLGKRFMRLTHVGRRSGKTYQTVLAVLHLDEKTHEILAVSPWSGSQWYRNIQSTPALAVETGDLRNGPNSYRPIQRAVTPDEIAAAFIEFRPRYPIFSRLVARIPGWKIDSPYEEFLVLAHTLQGVSFRPQPTS